MSAPKPDCKVCGGTGMVEADYPPPHPPRFDRCACALRNDLLENVDRGYVNLSSAPPIPSSPLLEKVRENVWVTAGDEFLAHLRHVALRQPLPWDFKVVSDAELTTAWLGSVALQGLEVLDADAYTVSTRFVTLVDLVIPPALLVIRMGVKAARNQAAPEVLQEALQTRTHEKLPTWLWDEPNRPLDAGHLFWSDSVGRVLKRWTRISTLEAPPISGALKKGPKKLSPASPLGTSRRSYRSE